MKATDAIQSMLDAGLKGGKKFRILEGLRLSEQVAALSKDTGISEGEINDALKRSMSTNSRPGPRAIPRVSCSPTPTR